MDTETSTYIDNIIDRRIIVAFDLFGTLLSTESIAKKLAEYHGDKADSISAAWRKYQLEYTWRLNSMGVYEPFDVVTKKSLIHAISEATGTALPPSDPSIPAILSAYASLAAFPDVKPCLDAISSIKHIQLIIFTNGSPQMVNDALQNTPELDLFTTIRDAMLSADEIEKYKPHPMIYQYLAAKAGKSIDVDEKHGGIDEVVLISANPFDVSGAQAAGMTAVWVDRAGKGWHDALTDKPPKNVVASLEELKGILEGILEKKAKVWDEVGGSNKA
ncbi:hypothetical protein TWF696_006110 [Orbilia brochopaga]|uniref:Haloacid dehalogenase n=1 Tax=Orbilia brochopaga TaxID=3140254 RepID=A0AAV9UV73_9PEZI